MLTLLTKIRSSAEEEKISPKKIFAMRKILPKKKFAKYNFQQKKIAKKRFCQKKFLPKKNVSPKKYKNIQGVMLGRSPYNSFLEFSQDQTGPCKIINKNIKERTRAYKTPQRCEHI